MATENMTKGASGQAAQGFPDNWGRTPEAESWWYHLNPFQQQRLFQWESVALVSLRSGLSHRPGAPLLTTTFQPLPFNKPPQMRCAIFLEGWVHTPGFSCSPVKSSGIWSKTKCAGLWKKLSGTQKEEEAVEVRKVTLEREIIPLVTHKGRFLHVCSEEYHLPSPCPCKNTSFPSLPDL